MREKTVHRSEALKKVDLIINGPRAKTHGDAYDTHVQFSFNDTPDDTVDNLQKALTNVIDKNKHYVSNISFVAKFEGQQVAEGRLYKEGEGRWINPQSETIH